jgi:CheY-like chemotaxis protein
VTLLLPRLRTATAVAAVAAPAAAPRPAEPTADAGGHVVLVVEDEGMVRDFAMTVLQEAGCRPIGAADGPAALEALEVHPEIALLFTDVVLTGPMNGRAVAEAALALRPGLPVLYTSGYASDVIVHDGRLDEGVNFLAKPYTAGDLAARVTGLLGGGAAGRKSGPAIAAGPAP